MAEKSSDSEGTLRKIEADKQTVEKMRKEAMERFRETKKRPEAEGDQGRQNKRGRTGNDAVQFLKQKKTYKENEFRTEELTLKKQHQQQDVARRGQMLAIMQQQQQQQTAAMMAVIKRLLPKKS